jgi:hypothetical protein
LHARPNGAASRRRHRVLALALVRCRDEEDDGGDDGPRDVAFVWRDPAATLPGA